MGIAIATVLMAALGLIFGGLLTMAEKKFHVEIDPRIEQVRSYCAGANCGACGYPGCDGFAEAVVKGEAPVDGCKPGGLSCLKGIAEVMGTTASETEPLVARVICQGSRAVAKERYEYNGIPSCRVAAGIAGGPKLCRFACLGLGDCMAKCKFGAIHMEDNLCVIDPNKCTGCGACVEECPRDVIKLLPRSKTVYVQCRNSDVARVARDICMTACIACGRCKKTCQHDAIVVEGGFAHIDAEKCVHCGECAAVCPCNCITIPEVTA
ncbi:MAG: RnfABCDGE type electron transport complex subunit B [Clostridia bacterium]|nr:RnfABCDGE type electron transport complex subunit B [Clostridia bacterium]